MLKFIGCIIVFICCTTAALRLQAQPLLPDSLRYGLQRAANDSLRFKFSRPIYTFYEETNRDSALAYAKLRYDIAKRNKRRIEEAYSQGQIAYQQIYLGRFSEALSNLTEAFDIANNTNDAETWELTPFATAGKARQITLSMLNHMYGHLKLKTGSAESFHYFKEGRQIGKAIGNDFRVTVADMVLASNYLLVNQLDSALFFAKEGEEYGIRGNIGKYLSYIYAVMGDIYRRRLQDSLALLYYQKALAYAIKETNNSVAAAAYQSLINYYNDSKQADSMLYYAKKNLVVISSLGAVTSSVVADMNIGKAYEDLANAYNLKNQTDSTNKYLKLALRVKDSLNSIKVERLGDFQRLTLDQQISLQELEKNRVATETKRRLYLLIGGIITAVVIIALIYRNNRQKQRANKVLKNTLIELKSTQAQLIQSEKMASLGELTAGIAHEIQNPLNFVNNFSEVSTELIDELNEELNKGDVDEAKAIGNDIKQNLEKINHHGRRADAIVKGMLQHSRTSSGKKEPTDMNVLTDEYLRLAYHGLRAKDKAFNATLQTDYDQTIGTINIIPQDMGRVILNLITNAFYAVDEKQKTSTVSKDAIGLETYKPTVSVSTKKTANTIEIKVYDNGNGIPPNVLAKVFQPFFTTKPTGQGTGLGLSLAYDIVKAHGGELTVQTKEGEGTTFVVSLAA